MDHERPLRTLHRHNNQGGPKAALVALFSSPVGAIELLEAEALSWTSSIAKKNCSYSRLLIRIITSSASAVSPLDTLLGLQRRMVPSSSWAGGDVRSLRDPMRDEESLNHGAGRA